MKKKAPASAANPAVQSNFQLFRLDLRDARIGSGRLPHRVPDRAHDGQQHAAADAAPGDAADDRGDIDAA
jgi:hypothetical protein